MSAALTVLNSSASVHHGQEALATVLGVCLLIIGLCGFAGVILLFQLLQRTAPNEDSSSVTTVPTRRVSKPTAVTTQFRPLGESLRHRGEAARQSAVFERAGSLVNGAIEAVPETAHGVSPEYSFARTSADARIVTEVLPVAPSPASTAIDAAASVSVSNDAAAGSLDAGPAADIKQSEPRPIDEIDIELLCRIDEALASGVMRPQQATQLLKSYGCDVEDLLRKELGADLLQVDGGDRAATRLASAPLLGGRRPLTGLDNDPKSISTSTSAAVAVQANVMPKSSSAAALSAVAAGPANMAPSVPSRTSSRQIPSGITSGLLRLPGQGPAVEGSASPSSALSTLGVGKTASGGSAGGGTNIDDTLLLKLDMALASGCVRPEQATQLLKSYGCDLEELLKEELVDGPIRRVSSDLSL